MLASELYARFNGEACEGPEKCHWCLAPCPLRWKHDDVPFQPFVKSAQFPKYPAGKFICRGCWLWRRKNLSVNYFDGEMKDRQSPMLNSWFYSKRECYALKNGDTSIYRKLLMPPLQFCLSLLTEKGPNLIHMSVVNDLAEISADTPLKFTSNNHVLEYSIYELEQAIEHGSNGKMPGVRMLMNYFGQPEITVKRDDKETKPLRGRPVNTDKAKHEEWKKMKRQVK
jgi:hypothetical protein